MASGPDGRLFCVTGYQCQLQQCVPTGQSPTAVCANLKNEAIDSMQLTGQSDTESNTSGYLSSSSFESSAEERRLGLNEHKVLHLWTKWGEQIQIPHNSMPKHTDNASSRKCISVSIPSEKSSQAVKKNVNFKQKIGSESSDDNVFDSFCNIQSPKMLKKSSSEGKIRKGETTCAYVQNDKFNISDNSRQCHPVTLMHNAVPTSDSEKRPITEIEDLRRKPNQSGQNSLEEVIQQFVKRRPQSVACEKSDFVIYYGLPRYSVTVDCDNELSRTKSLVTQLSETCADFSEVGVPVDECMSEFLSNVDNENLAGFLQFYDRVTSGSAYERARRNPKNYEAVYY